jgi:hypothetical protein
MVSVDKASTNFITLKPAFERVTDAVTATAAVGYFDVTASVITVALVNTAHVGPASVVTETFVDTGSAVCVVLKSVLWPNFLNLHVLNFILISRSFRLLVSML